MWFLDSVIKSVEDTAEASPGESALRPGADFPDNQASTSLLSIPNIEQAAGGSELN